MTARFRVLEVYRPPQRTGPILVGTAGSGRITAGTRLTLIDDTGTAVAVVAVDLPTEASAQAGRIAVVVAPDVGAQLRPGAEFEIDDSPTPP